MSYDKQLFDSDLDAFKNAGAVKTATVVMSGTIPAGAQVDFYSEPVSLASPDFQTISYASSTKHANKYKPLALNPVTMVFNNTTGVDDLGVDINAIIADGTIRMKTSIFNPYASPSSIQTTTLTFRFVPYEATF